MTTEEKLAIAVEAMERMYYDDLDGGTCRKLAHTTFMAIQDDKQEGGGASGSVSDSNSTGEGGRDTPNEKFNEGVLELYRSVTGRDDSYETIRQRFVEYCKTLDEAPDTPDDKQEPTTTSVDGTIEDGKVRPDTPDAADWEDIAAMSRGEEIAYKDGLFAKAILALKKKWDWFQKQLRGDLEAVRAGDRERNAEIDGNIADLTKRVKELEDAERAYNIHGINESLNDARRRVVELEKQGEALKVSAGILHKRTAGEMPTLPEECTCQYNSNGTRWEDACCPEHGKGFTPSMKYKNTFREPTEPYPEHDKKVTPVRGYLDAIDDEPREGELVWYEDVKEVDGEEVEYLYATTYEKESCQQHYGLVKPTEIEGWQEMVDALMEVREELLSGQPGIAEDKLTAALDNQPKTVCITREEE